MAETFTLESDMNQGEICEVVGITDKTYRSWYKKYGWEKLKEANNVTVGKIIARFYSKIYRIMDEDEHKKESLLAIIDELLEKYPKEEQALGSLLNGVARMEIPSGDSIAKYTSALKIIKGDELGLTDYIRVFKEMTEWLFTQGDINRKILLEDEEEIELNGVAAAKQLNLWMKAFFQTKING